MSSIQKRLRVLIVDDTIMYRKIITDALQCIPYLDIVDTAANGKIALYKIKKIRPDIVTLDYEMPVMNGLETIRRVKEIGHDIAVVMVSSHTREGASITIEALELGAFDFISKPDNKNLEQNRKTLEAQLKPIINSIRTKKILRTPFFCTGAVKEKKIIDKKEHISKTISSKAQRPEIIVIGVSTGGPNALAEVIPGLPSDLHVPVIIVQHMPPVFTGSLAESLDKKSAINVVEASDGMELTKGTVYIAPGGKQMKIIQKEKEKIYLETNDDPPENHCKPSVDYLFRSIAKIFKGRALGIIMTGMGSDGVLGLRLMKRHGAGIIAQDEETCVVYGMPYEAVKAGVTDAIVPLNRISEEIIRRVE